MPEEDITEEFLWSRLRPFLDYLSREDIVKVREALSLASDAHAGQLRKSGEPFITHPLEVSSISLLLLTAVIHLDAPAFKQALEKYAQGTKFYLISMSYEWAMV